MSLPAASARSACVRRTSSSLRAAAAIAAACSCTAAVSLRSLSLIRADRAQRLADARLARLARRLYASRAVALSLLGNPEERRKRTSAPAQHAPPCAAAWTGLRSLAREPLHGS